MAVAVTEELLRGIVDKIVEHFHPEKIILFGSHAWGTPAVDSDLDLLVITEALGEERPARRALLVERVCRPRFVAMDIIVRTPQEIQMRLKRGDFFLRGVLERGRVLYERKG